MISHITHKPERVTKGFTIIELLIVIVVIGILASIMVVSYVNVTKQAKATGAYENALSVQKVAESYFADFRTYPSEISDFNQATVAKLAKDIIILPSGTSLDDTNGEHAILYKYKGTEGLATGASIQYYDFNSDALSDPIFIGNATTISGLTQPTQ